MVEIDDLFEEFPNKEYRKTLVYGEDVNELLVEATALLGKNNVAEAIRRMIKSEMPQVIEKAKERKQKSA